MKRTFLLAASIAMAAAGCSSSTTSSGTPASTATSAQNASTPSTAAVSTSQCGTKPGVQATGTPIALGAIATDQPGTSFTDIPNMAKAYFDCVNANGGINGHPVKYYIETEQTSPAQIAADAKQLVQTDHVLGIVGNTSTGPYTVQSVNAAFKAVKDFNTGMLCQLWTYGDYPLRIPNNNDYTVTPDNGKMTTAQGCTDISSVDPQIAQYRSAAGTAAMARKERTMPPGRASSLSS